MKLKRSWIKNKRGDKIISVYWFVILFLVAAAISYMVFSFYGKPYDVREIEANALTNRVANCISEGGYLKEEVLTPVFSENFLAKCNLNFEVEDAYDWKESEQYFVRLEIFEIKTPEFDSKEKVSEAFAGNGNLRDFCETPGKYMPICAERSLYSIDKENVQYQVNILSIVKKIEKNTR